MSFNKSTAMYEGYIYKIINDVNNKIYIGQTRRTIGERWKSHVYDAKRKNDNMIIHKAMVKYGIEKFHPMMIEKIIKCTPLELEEELNKKEKYYIAEYNTMRPSGYNISIGGNILDFNKVAVDQYDLDYNYINSFSSITEASLLTDIPQSSIGQCVSDTKISNKSAYGYVFVKSGMPPYKVNEQNRKVNQYDLFGNLIKTYNSIKDAAKFIKINASNITNCCQKKNYKTAGNYIWRYEEDSLTYEEVESLLNGTYLLRESTYPEIKQYDIFGEYIRTYPNVSVASKFTNATQAAIIGCCLGKNNTANKYVWRFIEDDFAKYNINYSTKISQIFPYINMYSLDNNFIKMFSSPTEACTFIKKKNISAICNCCNHINKTSYGYKWFWIFDDKQPCKDHHVSKNDLYNFSRKEEVY